MPRKIEFSPDAIAEIIQEYGGGKSMNKIALARGCAKNTIRARLIEAGVRFDVSRSLSQSKLGKPSPRRGVRGCSDKASAAFMIGRSKAHEARRGRPLPENTRANISAALKGQRRRFTDEQWKCRESVRQALKRFLRRSLKASGQKKCTRTEAALGYRVGDLVAHLGPRPVDAHIDHIVPVVEFFRRGIWDPAVINALPNLRWLGSEANRRKGASVPSNADEIILQCLTKTNGGYSAGIAA